MIIALAGLLAFKADLNDYANRLIRNESETKPNCMKAMIQFTICKSFRHVPNNATQYGFNALAAGNRSISEYVSGLCALENCHFID